MKIADLFVKLGLKSADYERGIDKAQKKTNAFTNGIKKIGGAIAGVFAVQKIASFTSELAKLSGEAEGVRAAFNRIADDRTLEQLETATANTVSKLELMKRAVSANNLGIPIENLASLFEFATKRAQDTGESVDYLVNSIVTGIGRKSPLILDNLGISAIQLREKLRGVGMETASVADIAAAVGEIAADSMEASGKVIDSNAIKIQNLSKQWEDFKLSVAESPEFNKAVSNNLKELQDMMEVAFSKSLSGYEKFVAFTSIGAKNMAVLAEKSRNAKKELQDIKGIATTEPFGGDSGGEDGLPIFKGITTVADRIKQLQKEISTTKKLLTSGQDLNIFSQAVDDLKELESELKKLQDNLPTVRESLGSFSPMAGIGTPSSIAEASPMPTELGDMTSFLAKNAEMTKKYTDMMLADWTNFTTSLGTLVEDGIVNFIDEFAYSLGQLATGQISLQGFFNNIISQLGKFLGQIGKMMIAFGVAQLAFGNALKNVFNPAMAPILIGAGIALVAISGAIGGLASKAGGSGSASGTSINGASLNIKTVDRQDRELVARVSGRDLAFVLEKRTNYTMRS